jgi:CubicO group peptidase (beta-lactamase class C family)
MSVQAIEAALHAAQTSGGAPGFVAAARLPDGGGYQGAFGHRGVADPAPMSDDTLFWIASMTKALTSVGALQLVEHGALSLDQDAAAFIPAINEVPILEGFDPDGAPRLRAARRPVTVRHLLTHTSGFGYVFMSPELARYAERTGADFTTPMAIPRLFEAGERWLYGISTDLVGQVVEAVSGQTLDVYLKAQVFDPLGMADTTFTLSPEQAARAAAMHARLPDGSLAPIEFPLPPAPNPGMGGGGLYSTARDYLAFLKALLDGGVGAHGRILRPETVALMLANHVRDLDCGDLVSSSPAMTNDFKPLPGVAKRWGLGFLLNQTDGPDGRRAGAGAWAGLSNCYYWLDPAAGAAGVILSQILPFADPACLDIAAAFERAVYA